MEGVVTIHISNCESSNQWLTLYVALTTRDQCTVAACDAHPCDSCYLLEVEKLAVDVD